MYETSRTLELYHHGVKGMKWGVRRKQIRSANADRRIGQIGTSRSASKMMLDAKNKAAEARYYGGRAKVKNTAFNRFRDNMDAKQLKRAKARNKVDYDISELSNKYDIARQKARKDPSYKKTPEYKAARNDLGKSYLERMVFGDEGYMRIHTDTNLGSSKQAARGKEIAIQLLGRIA